MKDPNEEKNVRDQLKAEFDEVLFAGIEFDDRMKERVRMHIQSKPNADLGHRRSRSALKRIRMMQRTAAGAAALLVVSAAIWFGGGGGSREANLPPEVSTTMESGGGAGETANAESFSGGDTGLTVMGTSDNALLLPSQEEAARMFGEGWRAVRHVPEAFELREIEAHSEDARTAATITMKYASEDGRSYTFALDKSPFQTLDVSGEPVDIHGRTAYIQTSSAEGTTVLSWTDDGVQFRIAGSLTEDEAIRIAESIYE